MQVVQVVKRFGPVGGMEEYVFRLSKELSNAGLRVTVLCEKVCTLPPEGLDIIELGLSAKLRWLAHYEFSRKVNLWLSGNPDPCRVVHSHERQSMHHVTTFHTTPFNQGRSWVWKFLSLRNFFYERLERRELCADSIKAIVPVSNLLGEMIKRKHPKSESLLKDAVHPGVFMETEGNFSKRKVPFDGGTLGFIGKEWKRKGLPKVVEVWRELKKTRPKLKLRIAGVTLDMVTHLVGLGDKDIEVLGLIKDKESFYTSIDLLVHPAKHEAFGMVITEALSMGVPVLCSSECGASECVNSANGFSLPSTEKLISWADKASEIMSANSIIKYEMSWQEVASRYADIYSKL